MQSQLRKPTVSSEAAYIALVRQIWLYTVAAEPEENTTLPFVLTLHTILYKYFEACYQFYPVL